MNLAGTVVILAAGQGTRMQSQGPKVLQELCGRPMLGYVLDQARALQPERILVVVGHGAEEVRSYVTERENADGVEFIVQEEQRGTGHAVLVCAAALEESPGPVVVLYGDMPLMTGASLLALAEARGDARAAALTAVTDHPRGFGRILRAERGPAADGPGPFLGVVEEADATLEQRAIREVNVGVYCFDRDALLAALPRLESDNEQGELYLTDVLGMQVEAGEAVPTLTLENESEAIGVNTLQHLAEARSGIQAAILTEHLANGVFIEDPASTYIDHGVEIGAGTRILPCTVIRSGVRIGARCEVGPFTHLRVGTVMLDGAEVGNFTESKKSTIGEGTKAKHLSYLGDVTIGARVNIGAGTIVANYDGKHKHPTVVEDDAFIGSGSILIAPTTVGKGALTGAGAVVKKNTKVPPGTAWVGVPASQISDK